MDFLMSFRRLDVKLDRVLQGIFLVAASGIVLVDAIPLLRRRLLVYGVRGTPTEEMHLKTADAPSSPIPIFESELSTPTSNTPAPYVGLLTQPFVQLLALNVPHSWYTHFYILSVLSSIFWGWQLLSEGPVLRTVLAYYDSVGEEARETKGMTMNQIVLVWALMGAQGVRRLYESVAVFKPSASTMSIFHYIGGLGFYGLIGIAVWIEGASTLATHKLTYPDLFPNAPSLRTMICLPIFMFASGIQHDCHCYLASLKKYSLPEHPMFNYIVSPHYSAECLIYLSLALIAAPPERLINRTLLSALAFIVANLTIAARMSKEWYIRKFDEEKVKEKWAIVPPIF